jgi:hypothetical protein
MSSSRDLNTSGLEFNKYKEFPFMLEIRKDAGNSEQQN